jgi:hypothetical protein
MRHNHGSTDGTAVSTGSRFDSLEGDGVSPCYNMMQARRNDTSTKSHETVFVYQLSGLCCLEFFPLL